MKHINEIRTVGQLLEFLEGIPKDTPILYCEDTYNGYFDRFDAKYDGKNVLINDY